MPVGSCVCVAKGTKFVNDATPMNEEGFRFGENWRRFLALLDEPRILSAEQALRQLNDPRQSRGLIG